ncbi:MAG: hypothetical protein RR090_05865 [Niameybacter sp.]|uniref:hypothetical protein n=1 Tax=Niameybacter sp. TaxID=2033640 RepID=UPI002FCC94F9
MAKPKKISTHLLTLENLLSYKYITNSYKLFWYKSLITQIHYKKQKCSLEDLSFEMVIHAWELVAKKGITFGRLDKLHRVIHLIIEHYNLSEDSTVEALRNFLPTIKDKEILELLDEVVQEVCFEFIAPLYDQKLKKVSFNKRYMTIEIMSQENATAPYVVKDNAQYILFNSDWMTYFTKNTREAENLFHDSLAFFLDRHAMSHK